MQSKNLGILGVGAALPSRVVTNAEVARLTGLTEERIQSVFEIEERRWARGETSPAPPEGSRCSDLAASAGRLAIENARLASDSVDALVVVSTTPDFANPAMDHLVAAKLGIRPTVAFSLQAACTGMFRAAAIARSLLASGEAETVLVIAADTPSPFFRFGSGVPQDQLMNAALYGDGAGAMVIACDDSAPSIESLVLSLNEHDDRPGILFPGMHSAFPPEPQSYDALAYLGYHDFARVLERGRRLAWRGADLVMQETGWSVDDVGLFLTHQATGNLPRIAGAFGIPPEKLPVNIARVGNTVSASILILLDELVRGGRLTPGDPLVLHTAESATWSSAGMGIRWR